MKKIMPILSLCFTVGLVLCFQVWADEIKGPSMIIEKPSFDAGEVKEGVVIKHGFALKNVGDTPLEIQKVKPG